MELKSCPFCGSDKLLALSPNCHVSTPYNPADRMHPVIRCRSCGAEAAGKDNDGPTDDRSTDSAIEAWNTRQPVTIQKAAEVLYTGVKDACGLDDLKEWLSSLAAPDKEAG